MADFPASFSLATLDGTNGFVINGVSGGHNSDVLNGGDGNDLHLINGDAKVDYQLKINGDVTGDSGGWLL